MGLFWDLIQQSEIEDQKDKANILEQRVSKLGNYFKHVINKIILVVICLVLGCKPSNKKSDVTKTSTETTIASKDSLSSNAQWLQAINTKNLEALKELYVKDIYGLSPNGIEFSHRDTLIKIVAKNNFVVKNVNTLQRITANTTYDYEIGSFKNKNGDLIKHLIIWDTSKKPEKRVLEFLAEANNLSVDLNTIDSQRDKWIKLCNAHNAEHLINALYSNNTMYYNHRPMIVGRDHLIPKYAYMNNTNYQLTLHPLIIEPVSDSIVYEIGQCKGSYKGKYILIWQKTDQGWQILFDSNI